MLAFGLAWSFVHAITVTVSWCVQWPSCIWQALFHCRYLLSLALTVFLSSLPKWYQSHYRRGMMKLCYLELSITVSFSIHDRHCVALTALLPLGLHCNSGFTFTPSDNGFTASCLFRAFTPAFSCHMPPGLSGYETVETESTTSLSFLHASNASTIWTTLLI